MVNAEAVRAIRMLALLVALGQAGCATMSGDQCRTAKWEEAGRADGRRGQRPERLDEHREACARHGIEPKADDWRRGYAQGVNEFCTPAGAYAAGRANVGDKALCAGKPGEQEFRTAHHHGGQVFMLLSEVREMYRDLHLAAADRPNEWLELRDSEFVRTLRRREQYLKQRDGEYCDQYGVERLTDADLDPGSGYD